MKDMLSVFRGYNTFKASEIRLFESGREGAHASVQENGS